MNYKNDNTEKFEYLSGNIERITYHNQENGFAVLKVNVRGRKDLASVIGVVPSISVGEDITAKGFWRNNIDHELIKEIKNNAINNNVDNDRVKTLIDIIYYQACIIEGDKITDTKDFINSSLA